MLYDSIGMIQVSPAHVSVIIYMPHLPKKIES